MIVFCCRQIDSLYSHDNLGPLSIGMNVTEEAKDLNIAGLYYADGDNPRAAAAEAAQLCEGGDESIAFVSCVSP